MLFWKDLPVSGGHEYYCNNLLEHSSSYAYYLVQAVAARWADTA